MIAVIAFMMITALWSSRVAFAQQSEWKGRIDSMPASGLEGDWVIGGRAFTADSQTDFRTDKGDFGAGVCVEVDYVGDAEPYTATKIATKSQDDCHNGGATPSETPSPEPSSTPDAPGGKHEMYGIVASMPASGFAGEWVIGNMTFTATPGTEFEQRYGPLVVGACAKVEYNGEVAQFTAREIKSRPADYCNGTIPPAPSATPKPDGEIETYGRIDSFPENLVGDWVIDGVTYTATDRTEFKQEDGAFDVGVCVKLHARSDATPPTLKEVETERDHKCNGDHNSGIIGEGELYGDIQSLPDGLIGDWNIAGLTFTVDAGTKLEQEGGAFTVGMMVKVHFVIDTNGNFYAREIEVKSHDRENEGHAYGVIESIPDGRIGVWTIGGSEYTVNDQTRLKEEHGLLEAGARVRVKYYVDSNGLRVAKKIETTHSSGGASDPKHVKIFGAVEQMPAGGTLVGEWTIDGVVYVTDSHSKIKEDHGLLGVGAYVEVEYAVVNGQNLVHEMETHVPPGAGTDNQFGVIEDKGGASAAAVDANETWRIGGVSYLVTPATDIDDLSSALEVGSTALVNSYQAADGTLVATQVRGVTVTSSIFLPAVIR